MWTIRRKTPPMRGTKVLRMQKALRMSSFAKVLGRPGEGFCPGPIDGEAGPKTLGAMKRAKFWLGYSRPNRSGGWLLLAYLEKRRKLTSGMRRRRVKRIEAKPKTPLRSLAYKHAISQLGQREGGYNICKFTKWWWRGRSWRIGWCSIFASWCYRQAGSKTFYPCRFVSGLFTAEGYSDYSEAMLIDAKARRRGLSVVSAPEPGDLVVWQWDTGATDHTSIFERLQGGMVVSIDGNVPDVVKRCVRSKSRVRAFIRVSK